MLISHQFGVRDIVMQDREKEKPKLSKKQKYLYQYQKYLHRDAILGSSTTGAQKCPIILHLQTTLASSDHLH